MRERTFSTIFLMLGLVLSYYLGYLRGLGVLSEEQLRSLIVFIAVLAMLATEYRHRTVAVLTGILALWFLGIVSGKEMLEFIDLEVIGLLFGAMTIVGALEKAGFFEIVGSYFSKLPVRNAFILVITLSSVTAILSAFLDNVTTTLFMMPIALSISRERNLNPIPVLLGLAMASNIGGMSTLVGSLPNILIASAIGLTFNDFLLNATPLSIISFIVSLTILYLSFREELSKELPLETREEEVREVDKPFLIVSLISFTILLILFFSQDFTGIKPGEAAILASLPVFVFGGQRIINVLQNIEWNAIIFVGGLLVLVGGLEKTGLLKLIALTVIKYITLNPVVTATSMLWISASLSAVIDNVPVAAVLIPIIKEIYSVSGNEALWWSLVAATALGGITTPISSIPNIIAYSTLKEEGYDITFKDFLKIGLTVFTSATLAVNIYLVIRYLLT